MVRAPGAPVDAAVLRRMVRALAHRGPDDEGLVLLASRDGACPDVTGAGQPGPARCHDVGLGNRRLSIIDLSPGGHQPMTNADGTLWITYNGEIYNYLELAAELRRRGYDFRTASDTEVILHAYEAWGVDCLHRFNGMWAFALWDARRRRLVCARDRFGEKPFYYWQGPEGFVFASEIKALLVHPAVGKAPNERAIFRYVARGYGFADTSDETFFEGIRQLPPAHFLVVDQGEVRVRRYWALDPDGPPATRTEAEHVEAFRALFEDAVRVRLRSDVPVGFCLSGGLDSSAIVCTAARLNGRKVVTFSSCAEDPAYDEREYIRPVVRHTEATAHWVFPDGKQLFALLPRLIAAQDEPWSNLNIFAHWHLMEAARAHDVPVLLNGHGGDEVLTGYYPHFASYQADLIRTGRLARFPVEFGAYRRVHGVGVAAAGRAVTRRLAWQYLRPLARSLRGPRLDLSHLSRDFAARFATPEPGRRRSASLLRDELVAGLTESPLPAWLRYEDRNSMAFSVETRQPFLDHRLVEFLFAVPDDLRIRDGMSKHLLRRALVGVVPEEVRTRVSKVGFTTPAALWFRREASEAVRELLESPELRARGIFDVAVLREQFEEHRSGRRNRVFAIWSWVNLELWFRHFFD